MRVRISCQLQRGELNHVKPIMPCPYKFIEPLENSIKSLSLCQSVPRKNLVPKSVKGDYSKFKFSRKGAILIALISPNIMAADDIPVEVLEISKMELRAGQDKLREFGYELAFVNRLRNNLYYWNYSQMICLSLKVAGRAIEEVRKIHSLECEKRLASTRKNLKRYSNNHALVSSPPLDKQRQQLEGKGYRVKYSIRAERIGRSGEYWLSEDGINCKHLSFTTRDGLFVNVINTKVDRCTNPYPANSS